MKKSYDLIHNPCWSKENDKDLCSFEKQKEYTLELLKNSH